MAQSLTSNPLNLFYCNLSPPASVLETEWTKWLSSEFIPALLKSKAVIRAALYRETGFAMIPVPSHKLSYIFICQTDFRRLQDSEMYKQVYDETNAKRFITNEGPGEMRNYRLIQDYNPKGNVNELAPNMLSVEMDPEDRFDFEDWYRKELLPKLSTLRGYLRSKRYQLSGAENSTASPFLALHEFQDLSKAFVSQKAHEEASTERMERHIEASEKKRTEHGGGFIRRGWILMYAEGYTTDVIPSTEQIEKPVKKYDSPFVIYWAWFCHLLVGITSLRIDGAEPAKFEPIFI